MSNTGKLEYLPAGRLVEVPIIPPIQNSSKEIPMAQYSLLNNVTFRI
ncbi:MAG: hypothetical protein GH151_05240 [Bacteroidetes bacterium]|nr:hypothetical protein [Bacteroidota bacterium]